MSHRFPKHPLLNTRVPDLEDVNANFYEIVEEVNGRLNEHNWDESATNGLVIGDLAKDLFVWHQASVYQEVDTGTTAGVEFKPNAGNWDEIPHDPQWRKVAGLTLTFTSASGLLWIIASWQLRPNIQKKAGTPSPVDETPCPSFALRINGTVLAESTLGTLDTNQYSFPGLSYGVWPQSTAIVIPVPSGEQTIDLMVRTGHEPVPGNPAWVGSRELIALEMRR